MKIVIKTFVFQWIVLFGLSAQSLMAGTYFVSQNSVGDGSGTTYANRMSVYDHNSTIFKPNDTIYLCDTITSKLVVKSSGKENNHILYRGDYGGHHAVLNFDGNPMIQFDGSDFLIFENIEMKNGNVGISSNGSSDYVVIKKCKIYNMTVKGIHISKSEYYTGFGTPTMNTNIIIGGANGDGNDIYNCGKSTSGTDVSIAFTRNFEISYNRLYATGTAYGIDGIATHNASNGQIEYNTIHSHNYKSTSGEDGIDLKENSNNIVIRYNNIYNHQKQSGITVQMGSNNIEIFGNSIHNNNWAGVMIKKGDYSYAGDMNNITVRSNIIYDNGGGVVIQDSGSANIDINRTSIFNNVFADNGGRVGVYQGAGVMIDTGLGHLIYNNIFLNNSGVFGKYPYQQVSLHDRDKATFNYNQYYFSGVSKKNMFYVSGSSMTLEEFKNIGQESSGNESNPLFINYQYNNYSLSKNSPCINTGKKLDSIYASILDPNNADFKNSLFTIENKNQNSYGQWERGAFVYTGSGTNYSNPDYMESPKNLELY